jgi:subtilase family serine protease
VTLTPTLTGFPSSASGVTIFAIVDPDNAIPECNEGNNKDSAAQQVSCGPQ